MRSIEARFKKEEQKDRGDILHGHYIYLAKAITSQKFSHRSIAKSFKKLMPKDEYAPDEAKALISYLDYLASMPEGRKKQPEIAHYGVFIK